MSGNKLPSQMSVISAIGGQNLQTIFNVVCAVNIGLAPLLILFYRQSRNDDLASEIREFCITGESKINEYLDRYYSINDATRIRDRLCYDLEVGFPTVVATLPASDFGRDDSHYDLEVGFPTVVATLPASDFGKNL